MIELQWKISHREARYQFPAPSGSGWLDWSEMVDVQSGKEYNQSVIGTYSWSILLGLRDITDGKNGEMWIDGKQYSGGLVWVLGIAIG